METRETVTVADIEAAATRLVSHAVRTPLMENDRVNERIGGRLLVKAECLQRSGSFKFRGAFNAMSLTDVPHLVAFSSGNHAQGVALAARLLGRAATIVMPDDAPSMKRRNTEAHGARVVTYDRHSESREAIGVRIAAETGAELIRPYDDPRVIAGQGTVGLEIAAQCATLDVTPDQVLVCCGGGGLVAGTAMAVRDRLASTDIFAVEPEAFDDTRRSLETGSRKACREGARSICDALLAPEPGEITFEINKRFLTDGLAVSDHEALVAMRTAFEDFKVVAEPGGAVALAAALFERVPVRNRTTVIVISGGNCDAAMFARALGTAEPG